MGDSGQLPKKKSSFESQDRLLGADFEHYLVCPANTLQYYRIINNTVIQIPYILDHSKTHHNHVNSYEKLVRNV